MTALSIIDISDDIRTPAKAGVADETRDLINGLRRALRLTHGVVEAALTGTALSYAHWRALHAIAGGHPTQVNDIATELEITSPSATRLVDALEKRGLVRRDRSRSSDRRVVHVIATDAGMSLLSSIGPTVTRAWSVALAPLEASETRLLTEQLVRFGRMLENVSQHRGGTA